MQVLIYGNELFVYDMAWGFREAGCETTVINTFDSHEVIPALQKNDVKLAVTLGAPLELSRDVLAWLKSERPRRMKHVHWDTDGISSIAYDSVSGEGIAMDAVYAAEPDLVLTMCPEMLELLRKKGISCGFMHYAYCPLTHHPMPEVLNESEKRIHLAGNVYVHLHDLYPDHYRYQSMRFLLKPLTDKGCNVHVYSHSDYLEVANRLDIHFQPGGFHQRVPYGSTCELYNSACINLVTQNHALTITKRTFEIMGCGCFVLSADNTAIRELFMPGRDLVVSDSAKETLELAEHYLSRPEERERVKQNALKIMKIHTYHERAAHILREMKLEDSI